MIFSDQINIRQVNTISEALLIWSCSLRWKVWLSFHVSFRATTGDYQRTTHDSRLNWVKRPSIDGLFYLPMNSLEPEGRSASDKGEEFTWNYLNSEKNSVLKINHVIHHLICKNFCTRWKSVLGNPIFVWSGCLIEPAAAILPLRLHANWVWSHLVQRKLQRLTLYSTSLINSTYKDIPTFWANLAISAGAPSHASFLLPFHQHSPDSLSWAVYHLCANEVRYFLYELIWIEAKLNFDSTTWNGKTAILVDQLHLIDI